MNLEKVIFGFFIILAFTLNFGFFLGEIDEPAHHNVYELYAAIVVNIIATALKLGDRTQTGALLLASSLVAVLQLIAAAAVWGYASHVAAGGMDAMFMASIVSLAGGAMVANLISVLLLIADTVALRR